MADSLLTDVEGGGFGDQFNLNKNKLSEDDIRFIHEEQHGSGRDYWKQEQYDNSAYDSADPNSYHGSYDQYMKDVAADSVQMNATVMSVLCFAIVMCIATGYGSNKDYEHDFALGATANALL